MSLLLYWYQLELRQIRLLLWSAAFLSATALVVLFAKPLYLRYQSATAELSNLQTLVSDAGPASSLAPLEQEVEQYEQALLGELRDVPVKQLESHIIGVLQSAAWEAGVDLMSIEPLEGADDLPYAEIAFQLELSGQYLQLDQWLRNVDQQLGYVVIKEYLLRLEQPAADPMLHARVLLAAYRIDV